MTPEDFKKLQDQVAQISNKLLALEQEHAKDRDPELKKTIQAMREKMEALEEKLAKAKGKEGAEPAAAAAPVAPAAPAAVAAVKKSPSFEQDLGLE